MAVETPVLERRPAEKIRSSYSVKQSYMDCIKQEEIHNARIRDAYARLINPDSRIEDVFSATPVEEIINNKEEKEEISSRPYLVENARADAAIFRADNPVNKLTASFAPVVDEYMDEEEDEDLRPTPTTIQYQTIGRTNAKADVKASAERRTPILGKKEKIIIAVFVGIVIALLALVIVNSSIIAGLNADIATVESEIVTVRGALTGVNASVSELVPEAIRDLLIK